MFEGPRLHYLCVQAKCSCGKAEYVAMVLELAKSTLLSIYHDLKVSITYHVRIPQPAASSCNNCPFSCWRSMIRRMPLLRWSVLGYLACMRARSAHAVCTVCESSASLYTRSTIDCNPPSFFCFWIRKLQPYLADKLLPWVSPTVLNASNANLSR